MLVLLFSGSYIKCLGRIVFWAILLAEALFFGGLSLSSQYGASKSQCLKERLGGGVLVWPWDGADDLWLESTLKSKSFQMVHSQAGATIELDLGFSSVPNFHIVFESWDAWQWKVRGLRRVSATEWGYRYAIVDKTTGRLLERRARDDVFGEKIVLKGLSYD